MVSQSWEAVWSSELGVCLELEEEGLLLGSLPALIQPLFEHLFLVGLVSFAAIAVAQIAERRRASRRGPSPAAVRGCREASKLRTVQRYLAHEKSLTPLGPPWEPRHRPTVGS